MLKFGSYYELIRYVIVPLTFPLFFTGFSTVLPLYGQNIEINHFIIRESITGNLYTWKVVASYFLWAWIWLIIPSDKIFGPETSFGYVPIYRNNGMQYYAVTSICYLLLHLIWPNLSNDLYINTPYIIGSLSISALILCLILFIKGWFADPKAITRIKKISEPIRSIYRYYSGTELHPRLFGVDVKQFTNCRIGLMGWQILILSYFITGCQQYGFNYAFFINFTLQTIYIAKFFYWESGYFKTLDIIMDRAGYYLCWGCIVWVPAFYTYSSYLFVKYPSSWSVISATVIFIVGIVSITINYVVDYQKEIFRSSKNGLVTIWGKPATFITAKYNDGNNKIKTSLLLTSGAWGITRHMNYTFELMSVFCWCILGQSKLSLMYFYFLFILLIHRIYRDEDKCLKKYKKAWIEYCKIVPYRLIPWLY